MVGLLGLDLRVVDHAPSLAAPYPSTVHSTLELCVMHRKRSFDEKGVLISHVASEPQTR
jgi:hypothetical protein